MLDGKTAGIGAAAFVAGAVAVFALLGTGGPPPVSSVAEIATLDKAAPDADAAAQDEAGAENEAESPDNPVVAVVGDSRLRFADLEAFKQLMPEQFRGLPTQVIYVPLLEQAISGQLLAEAGRKANLDKSPAIHRRISFIQDRLVQDAYLTELAADVRKTKATDAELEKRYQTFLESHQAEEQVHGRHILLKTEKDAATVIKQLDKGGDFAALAKEKSTGPSAPNGGDLGYFTKGEMVGEFSEAAFALKAGEYTKAPVQTQFGWHVISVVDRRTQSPPSLEEKREELVEQITREHILGAIEALRGGTNIERFNADGSPMVAEAGEAGAASDAEQSPAETPASAAEPATETAPPATQPDAKPE